MALIHRWPLTENANDVVGTLNLTNNGTVTFSADGASFNGSNQWLSGTKAIQTLSLSVWVKYSTAKDQCAFGFALAEYVRGFGARLSNPVWLYGNGGRVNGSTGVDLADNSYHCVVITRNQSTSSHVAFIDGVIKATSTDSFQMNSNFAVGRLGASSGWYFGGIALDARIYDHDLSESEVAALYAEGPNGNASTIKRRTVHTPVILSTMPAALTRGFR